MKAQLSCSCRCAAKMVFACIALIAVCASVVQSASTVLDIRDFGAKGDGEHKDTNAIQAAIDKASSTGGTVVVPPGRYISGTIHLRSNITVRLERGATILFSPDDRDFDQYETLPYRLPAASKKKPASGNLTPVQIRKHAAPHTWDDTETSYAHYSLFSGDGVDHVTIEGDGEIDGNRSKRGGPKPIAFRNSKWISIHGITIRNAPNYNISLMGSDYVDVDRVTLINGYADGIDPDNCHFVRITNSYIDVFDDAICPKASMALGKPRGTENLVVANCILRTNCNDFKFGTETEGDLKNVSVTNCVMLPRDKGRHALAGIALESVDGGHVEGVVISNIEMEEPLAPIFIRLGNRGRGTDKPVPGTLRDVSIQNVIARGASLASSITGIPSARVEDITIDGLNVTVAKNSTDSNLDVPEFAAKYPDSDMFGALPASALYARHATGLTIRNMRVQTEQANTQPAIVFDDVTDATISGFESPSSPDNNPVLLFHNVAQSLLYGNRLPSPTEVFLGLSGDKTHDIVLRANDLHLAHKIVEQSVEVSPDAVSLDSKDDLSH